MSSIEIDTHEIYIEPLDIEFHGETVEGFCSGYEVFDRFLQTRATVEQAHNISQTHLLFYQEQLIGYYTMSCSRMRIEISEAQEVYGLTDRLSVPALEIPFLAVDQGWQRNGVGGLILDQIIDEAIRLTSVAGCRYIILNAVRKEWLVRWYERNGFDVRVIDPKDAWNLPMFFRLPRIRGVLPPIEDLEAEAGI